jgi:hypothetical protein
MIIGNRFPLLDLLLKTSDEGKVLSNQDIRNEIDTFMFEGLWVYSKFNFMTRNKSSVLISVRVTTQSLL